MTIMMLSACEHGTPSARRRLLSLGFAVVALLATCCAPTLQGQAPPRIEKRVLQTDDNWQIYVTYYGVGGDATAKDAPVVVLLHGDKENRLVWEGAKGLAPMLHNKNYAVVSVDLRKHGQSSNVPRAAVDSPVGGKADGTNVQPADYEAMVVSDLEAVKRFIYEQHQLKRLNMNKMAIVGAQSTAAVAMTFAVNDWNKEPYDDGPTDESRTPRGRDVRALVLLSPVLRVRGLALADVLPELRDPEKNIAVLVLFGKLYKPDARDALAIQHKLAGPKGAEDRMYFKPYPFNLRGTDLLAKKEIDAESIILAFLNKHLMELRGSEWRDRQNRLNRK